MFTSLLCDRVGRPATTPPPFNPARDRGRHGEATDAVLVGLRALLLRVIGRERERLGLSHHELHGVAGLRAGSLDDGTATLDELRDALRVLRRLHRVRP